MVGLCVLSLAAIAASPHDAANQIAAVESRLGGRIGVAALDSGSGMRVDYRAEQRFPMCSTFKFLAAAAVLKRVDENREKLDRFVPYGAKDILEYAPVTKAHLGDGGMTLGGCAQRQSNRAITPPAICC
ncbi:MAG TPA: serine hydrolase [Candidatus Udaeobacter sp.]|nr:serine hydrolase [Candidatus Udaeobacter sp.]